MHHLLLIALASAIAAVAEAPTTVTARAIGPAPGAIVCRDLATVSAMVDLYSESMEERMQAVATGGASSRENGEPLPPPDLPRHGCALAKPGTLMTLHSADSALADVEFKLPNGKTFHGVTQTNMILRDDHEPRDQR